MTEYFVSSGAESLTAILNEETNPDVLRKAGITQWTPNASKRSVELQYRDANGMTTTLVIANGIITSATSTDPKGKKYNFAAFGYQPRVAELMQDLKPKLSIEWYSVLGHWLDAPANGQE